MKYYRCPWCGKASFKRSQRVSMSLPGLDYKVSQRAFRPRCQHCNGQVDFDFNAPIFLIAVVIVIVTAVLSSLLSEGKLSAHNIIVSAFVALPIVALAYTLLILFVTPPLARRAEDKSSLRFNQLMPNFQFAVEFEGKLPLNIESFYAIRIKDVDAEKINVHYDLVTEYKRDGAAVYIKADKSGSKMALLYPDYYDVQYFNCGTEFNVIDTEGEIIATGRITEILAQE